ncbi:hypothetical protein CL614_01705 [archaeon]|nr:hypothetical protein [archaeon]|tara:strand:- start:987 stop:1415 length:429 start_codon:yes stop_codon:yes gene_type:complete
MIRKAKQSDLKEIAKILKTEYKKTFKETWSDKGAIKVIRDYFHTNNIFVHLQEKIITGFIITRPVSWHDGLRYIVEEIAVSSKYQGKGIGRELIEYAENIARKKGAVKIELFAGTKSKAFKIYKKFGFKESTSFVHMTKKLK